MPTTTTSYSFQKPTVSGDSDAWGGYLNANWDKVDDLFDGTSQVDGIDMINATISATTLTAATADINGGTIDGAVIGGTVPEAATVTDLTITGEVTETVYTVTGLTPSLDPANGTIQMWTLTGASTPTYALAAGQSLTLGITASVGSVDLSGLTWLGGTAPSLVTDGSINWIMLWKVGVTTYASYIGAT